MDEKKQLLAQTMAVLMTTTPETNLGKLLNFCLSVKVVSSIAGKSPVTLAAELIENPTRIDRWLQEAIEGDANYSVDEMVALTDLGLNDPQKFFEQLWAELNELELTEVVSAD
ncbi:MAG: hypothetical protein AAGG02_03110 [Cyanobacteria bacterium P01_H01_bin.15]